MWLKWGPTTSTSATYGHKALNEVTFRFLSALAGHPVDPVALAAQLLHGADVGVAEEQALPLPLLVAILI